MNHLLKDWIIPAASAQGALSPTQVATETQDELSRLVAFIVGQIPLWITAIVVVVVSFLIARIAKAAVENKLTKEGFEEENKEITILAGRATNAGILILGVTIALKIAGIDLTAIIAAGAFGVGFALQDIIMNFIAGVMILSSRHFSIGDAISVNGVIGKIVEIQTRATVIKAFDGTKVVVPNSALFKNVVTSFTSNSLRRIELVSGVGYGSDLKKAAETVLKAASETPGVLVEPKPSVSFFEWSESSIKFKVKAWVESRGGWMKIRSNMLVNVHDALKAANIPVPYPIYTVQMMNKPTEEEQQIEQIVTEPPQEQKPEQQPEPESQQPEKLQPAPAPAKTDPEAVPAADWLKKASEDTPAPEETTKPEASPDPKPEPQAKNDLQQ